MTSPLRTQPVYIMMVLLGVLTGIFITAQFGSPPAESVDPYEPLHELQDSIDILSREQTELQESIGSTREQIQELESLVTSGERKKALDDLKAAIGLTEVTGEGIEVHLDDSAINRPTFTELPPATCYAPDLRDIVNILQVAGAKAIAINDQRIIDTTSIICVGQHVLVNNVRMLPPFTVVAAGDDARKLVTYLETEKFLPDLHARVARHEVVFDIVQHNDVVVPLYKGDLETNFIE